MVFFYKVYIGYIGGDSMFCNLFYRVLGRVLFSFCRKIRIEITYVNPFKYFSIFY